RLRWVHLDLPLRACEHRDLRRLDPSQASLQFHRLAHPAGLRVRCCELHAGGAEIPAVQYTPRARSPSTSDQIAALLYAVTPSGIPTNQNAAAMSGVINAGQEIT